MEELLLRIVVIVGVQPREIYKLISWCVIFCFIYLFVIKKKGDTGIYQLECGGSDTKADQKLLDRF